MTVYLDSSALVKLVVNEEESPALRSWLADRALEPRVTSVVGHIELARAANRLGAGPQAIRVFTRLGSFELNAQVEALAGQLPPPTVRSLDAIHVATAAQLADLTALVTYDDRMIAAAESLGLPVISPGR